MRNGFPYALPPTRLVPQGLHDKECLHTYRVGFDGEHLPSGEYAMHALGTVCSQIGCDGASVSGTVHNSAPNGGGALNQRQAMTQGIEAYKHVEFMLTTNYVLNTSSKYADAVLPVAAEWERPGTLLADDRKILICAQRIIDPLYEAKSDQEVAIGIAEKLGFKAGEVFTGEQLIEAVRGEEFVGETSSLPVFIRKIREKIEGARRIRLLADGMALRVPFGDWAVVPGAIAFDGAIRSLKPVTVRAQVVYHRHAVGAWGAADENGRLQNGSG